MRRFRIRRSEERGIALLSALALLFLFSLLGVAYVGYMATLADQARYQARAVQTRVLARSGVLTAIQEMETRIAQGNLNELPTAYEMVLPVYRMDAEAPNGIAAAENRRATTAIAISDESDDLNRTSASDVLAQAPRRFRIASRASVAELGRDGQERRTTQSRIEAVVVFGPGEPQITFWSELRGADDTNSAQTVQEGQDPIVE